MCLEKSAKYCLRNVFRLLVISNISTSLTHSTLMIGAIYSFETLVLTRSTRSHISKDGILLFIAGN
jgi:hypothetical protein